jgi:exonuclease III
MSILSWNCRGLGNLWTVRDLCRLVKEKRPNMVFLMETMLQTAQLERLKFKLGFDCVFVVDSKGKNGGLALFWYEDFHVTIQNFRRHHINAIVLSEEHNSSWLFTGFYGHPKVNKRKESWALLRHLSTFYDDGWCCVGDFNELLVASEKGGGGGSSASISDEGFS